MSKPKIKICIVDDHPVILQGLALMFADNPIIDVVATVRGGNTAMEAFSAMSAFDVAIVDLQMPGVSGFEVIELIGRLFPEAKTLAFTAHGELDLIQKALSCGASGFVQKSSDASTLAEAVEKVYSEGVYFCSQSLKLISTDIKGSADRNLTDRELEILELLKGGQNNNEISTALFISYSTVRFHIKNIYRKLSISGRSQLPD